MTDELCYVSATEALGQFRARELSPVELVEALIARYERVNPTINAFTRVYHEQALAAAREAEAVYARPSGEPRALEGIPVAIKEEHKIAGQPATLASRAYEHHVAKTTDPHVQRLLDAGAIVIGRATSPEFSSVGVTHSPLFGVTRNPWNPAYTPGGSSGGSAAVVAAGLATVADGSDYGGSIRIPASTCGVFGYKPPFGRNPNPPPWGFDPYNHYGPLTRTVADGALLQNVMSGWHPDDLTTLRERVELPLAGSAGDVRGWKVAWSLDLGYNAIDPDVRRNTLAALEAFRDLGCVVEEVEVGWTAEVLEAYKARGMWGLAGGVVPLLDAWRDQLSEHLVVQAELAREITAVQLGDVLDVQAAMYLRLSPILEAYDLFICPTAALPAVPADQRPHIDPVVIDGREVDSWLGWVLTYPFNMLSQLPVASVPSGIASNGVPTGIQLVARSYDDARVFRAAYAYEQARPWLDVPERRPGIGG